MPSESGYWSCIYNHYKPSGDPILMFFNVGNEARDYASLSDDEVIQSAFVAINHMYPHLEISRDNNLVAYQRTNWG